MRPATKIVCTIGPACADPDILAAMIEAGMSVARLNCSHGSHDQMADYAACVREASRRTGVPVGLMADLQGPKIRVGVLANPVISLADGATIWIDQNPAPGDERRFSVDYPDFVRDVKAGDPVLIDDGTIRLEVLETVSDAVRCRVMHGGELKPRKGLNLPGVDLSIPSFTDKDAVDLDAAMKMGVDFVALSFVRHPDDIRMLRERMKNTDARIIAKIERPEALTHIAAIIREADGVMVARGDLGMEIPLEQVPGWQKRILRMASDADRFAITATQMLDSMMEAPMPTRAEVSDVANAIIDGTDATMLSGETAVGVFPVESVATMASVATEAERLVKPVETGRSEMEDLEHATDRAIAASASIIANMVNARCIAAFTESGFTALLISKQRPGVPIYGITPHEHIVRQLTAYRGVIPMLADPEGSTDRLFQLVEQMLRSRNCAQPGDRVVLTLGLPFARRGTTNLLHVLEIEG